MSDRPSPDFSHIPGAHRAYHLPIPGTAPPPDPVPKHPSQWARYKKALISIAAAFLGAIVTGVTLFISTGTNKTVEQVFTEPLFIFDVKMLEPPVYYNTGHTVPGATFDEDLSGISWDPVFASLPTAAWTVGQGGSFAGWGEWEIVLEGSRDETITVTDLYPTDIECSAPEGGTFFPLAAQGIGEKIGLAVEIDDPGAQIKTLPTGQPNSFDPPDLDALPTFADSSTITLDRGEKEVINFQAHADEEYCEFALAIEYLADGKRQTSLITPPEPGHFAVAPVLDYADYDTVVMLWPMCPDLLPRTFTGAEAAATAELEAEWTASVVDCT